MLSTLRPIAFLLLLMAGLVPIACGTGARADISASAAQDFVRSMGNETLSVLKDAGTSKTRQITSMRSIFNRYFAVEDIGRFVLSRYWRKASDDERQEYLRLFEDLIVYGYAKRFSTYAGEQLSVIGSRPEGDGSVTVLSEIVSPDRSNAIAVNWQVETVGGTPRIVDVVVEGVSLKLTQRSDFGAVIKQQGGRVAGLIEVLRDKTSALKAEVES